eukprot:PhF_6_TR6416/c0_g1_i1/m.9651
MSQWQCRGYFESHMVSYDDPTEKHWNIHCTHPVYGEVYGFGNEYSGIPDYHHRPADRVGQPWPEVEKEVTFMTQNNGYEQPFVPTTSPTRASWYEVYVADPSADTLMIRTIQHPESEVVLIDHRGVTRKA